VRRPRAQTTGWLALALAVVATPAASSQRPVEERWPLDPHGSVRIVSPFGTIRVAGWDTDSVVVSARLGPRAGTFSSAGDAGVRKLWVEGPQYASDSSWADITVHVPRDAVLWVKSATARIEVEGVDGVLDLSSVSGVIHVVGTPRDVTAETMQGDVEIAGGTGRARVKTVSGQVLLRGASADLGASTLSGSIVVRAAGWQRGGTGVQRGKFESVTGDVRFDGELGRGGVIELESQSGKIEIRVPPTTVADFDALTIAGTISNTFNRETPRTRSGESGQELRFSTGVGGAQVTARSFKGAILLQSK
jgi:Putative adhesin